jgi:hypothetical protein
MQSKSHVYLVLELASDGELFAKISSDGGLPEAEARGYFEQLVAALSFMHSKQIYHRDLKLENLLLSGKTVKLADFGFSRMARRGEMMATKCGTPMYCAPEILLCETGYEGGPADVWSSGVVLYAMLCQAYPIDAPNLMGLLRKLKALRIEYPDNLSADVKDLLKRIFVADPNRRLTIEQIKAHKWMKAGLYRPPIGSQRALSAMTIIPCEERQELNAFEVFGRLAAGSLARLIGAKRSSSAMYLSTRKGAPEALAAASAAVRELGGKVENERGKLLRCTWGELVFTVEPRPGVGGGTLFVELARVSGNQMTLIKAREAIRQKCRRSKCVHGAAAWHSRDLTGADKVGVTTRGGRIPVVLVACDAGGSRLPIISRMPPPPRDPPSWLRTMRGFLPAFGTGVASESAPERMHYFRAMTKSHGSHFPLALGVGSPEPSLATSAQSESALRAHAVASDE